MFNVVHKETQQVFTVYETFTNESDMSIWFMIYSDNNEWAWGRADNFAPVQSQNSNVTYNIEVKHMKEFGEQLDEALRKLDRIIG